MTSLALFRIKIKLLAAEATALRKEETRSHWVFNRYDEDDDQKMWFDWKKRYPEHFRRELYLRRVNNVGVEQRASLLAYGFLRGRCYGEIEFDPRWLRENPDRRGPYWQRVAQLVLEYWPQELFHRLPPSRDAALEMIAKWREGELNFAAEIALLPPPTEQPLPLLLSPAKAPAFAPR